MSADAKDFILQLLQGDPADRMSAAQALEHPFLTVTASLYLLFLTMKGGAKTETREGAAEKLKMFNAKRKWQAFAQVHHTIHLLALLPLYLSPSLPYLFLSIHFTLDLFLWMTNQVVMATNKLKRLTEYGQDKAKKTSMSRLRKIFQQVTRKI